MTGHRWLDFLVNPNVPLSPFVERGVKWMPWERPILHFGPFWATAFWLGVWSSGRCTASLRGDWEQHALLCRRPVDRPPRGCAHCVLIHSSSCGLYDWVGTWFLSVSFPSQESLKGRHGYLFLFHKVPRTIQFFGKTNQMNEYWISQDEENLSGPIISALLGINGKDFPELLSDSE